MRNSYKAIVAAAVLGATSIAAVQPAEARDHTGVAVAAGIIGLGVGAAIASDRSRYNEGYYGSGYEPAYAPGYYGQGYYNPGYYAPSYGVIYESNGWGRRNWRDDRRHWDRGRGYDRGGRDGGGYRR